MSTNDERLLSAQCDDALPEHDAELQRRDAFALFSEAVRGPGPPDPRRVQQLVRQGLHRALTPADRAALAKQAYSSVCSGLEANIAAVVVALLES